MKYQPKALSTNHNVSNKHPLKDFVVLLAGVTAFVIAVYAVLGWTVDFAIDHLPDDFDETQFFTHNSPNSSTDISKQLQRQVDELTQCAGITKTVTISVINSEDINALALPGRHILVYQGLLDEVQTEIGLAFVLAHELAHFKHRDHLRGLGRRIVLGTVSVLLTGSNSSLTQALMPASTIGESTYSQSRETEADRAALRTLDCYYGNVEGAEELFEYLEKQAGTGLPLGHYLSSHPDPAARIQLIKHYRENR